ncbi:MAG: hypothetical protein LW650_09065 [Planctomycetaceae bacterium]|jgi:hypothetical protein|nr:hypothetical protein [Phycisphaerales bacterium]MCE2653628.1 hypothetical protein [Planctomycetaceae bacterium]
MPLFLDDKPLSTPLAPAGTAGSSATLRDLLNHGADLAARSGRMVVEVLLDGVRLDDDALRDAEGRPLADHDVRLISADPRALVAAALYDLSAEAGRLRELQAQTARHLQAGQLTAASDALSTVVAVWDALRQGLAQGPGLLGLDPAELAFSPTADADPQPVAGAIANLNLRLIDLRRCLAGEDWASLADLLQDELSAEADTWATMLADLADQLRAAAPAAPIDARPGCGKAGCCRSRGPADAPPAAAAPACCDNQPHH